MIRDFFRFLLVAILILIFAFVVYPTPYKFIYYNNAAPIKTNWITGNMWIFDADAGWKKIGK